MLQGSRQDSLVYELDDEIIICTCQQSPPPPPPPPPKVSPTHLTHAHIPSP